MTGGKNNKAGEKREEGEKHERSSKRTCWGEQRLPSSNSLQVKRNCRANNIFSIGAFRRKRSKEGKDRGENVKLSTQYCCFAEGKERTSKFKYLDHLFFVCAVAAATVLQNGKGVRRKRDKARTIACLHLGHSFILFHFLFCLLASPFFAKVMCGGRKAKVVLRGPLTTRAFVW